MKFINKTFEEFWDWN